MGLLPFSSGKPQPGNGPRLEQKQIYLCVLFPTKKVAVLTPLATNVTIRLNQMKLLVIWPCCCCCCWVASVVSDSVWPHRRQPTRLLRPWDTPGKNTGVGCHFLLQCMKLKSESEDSLRPHGLQPTRLMRFSRQEYWSRVPLPSPIGPIKMAVSCGTTLEKKLNFAYNDAFTVEGLRAKTNTIFCVDVDVWILQPGVSYGNC